MLWFLLSWFKALRITTWGIVLEITLSGTVADVATVVDSGVSDSTGDSGLRHEILSGSGTLLVIDHIDSQAPFTRSV